MEDLRRRVEELERKRDEDRGELISLKAAVETSEKHLLLKFNEIDQRMNKSDEKIDRILDQVTKVNDAIGELNASGAVTDNKASTNQTMLYSAISAVAAFAVAWFSRTGGVS